MPIDEIVVAKYQFYAHARIFFIHFAKSNSFFSSPFLDFVFVLLWCWTVFEIVIGMNGWVCGNDFFRVRSVQKCAVMTVMKLLSGLDGDEFKLSRSACYSAIWSWSRKITSKLQSYKISSAAFNRDTSLAVTLPILGWAISKHLFRIEWKWTLPNVLAQQFNINK